MTMPIDLVLVRHGESEQNLVNRRSKRGDTSLLTDKFRERHVSQHRLTFQGRLQADAAGQWLHRNGLGQFDRRYVSSYVRAMETAVGLSTFGPKWYVLPELREREWGDLDGRSWEERAELLKSAPARQDTDSFYWIPPNGESIAQVTVRLQKLFNTLHRECSDKQVLVVCHGEIMWALRYMIEGMSLERWEELEASEEPGVKIFNCQILHYTRRHPSSGELSEHIDWMRSVNALQPTNNGPGWEKVERCTFSDEDLAELVKKVPALFTEAEQLS